MSVHPRVRLLFVHPSVSLSYHLYFRLSLRPCIGLCVRPSICLCLRPSTCLCLRPSIYLSDWPSIQSTCLCVGPSVCPWVRPSTCPWSVPVGVLMWEVFSEGRMPYEHNTNSEVVEALGAGLRLLRPRLAPDGLYQLMEDCWRQVGKTHDL